MAHMGYSPGVRVAAERFFYWTYALIFLGSILSTLSSRLLAVGEQWIVTIIDATTRLLYGIVLVWCLTRDMRLSAIIVATTTQYVVAYLATLLVISLRHGTPYASPRGIPRTTRRELRKFSGWFQLNAILDTLTYETDPVVISVMVSPTATGIWSIATRLARQITYFGYIPNGNILPAVSAAVAANEGPEALQRIYTRASRIITLIGVVMGGLVISCGPVLFLAWLNNPFHEASFATILIALGILAGTPRPVAGAAIFALGKVGLGTRAQAVAFVVNTTLTLALVKPFGLSGVLVGTLVAKVSATSYLLGRFARLINVPARQLIAPWLTRVLTIGAVATISCRVVMDHWSWALETRSHAGLAALALTALFGTITLLMLRATHLFTRDDMVWLRGAMPTPLRRLFPDRAISLLSSR
jgi:O-antigen/teichoic acid export membrane protein